MVKKLLIDADAFVALYNTSDINHKLALKIAKALSLAKIRLFTSDPAYGEVITVISQNIGHRDAVEFAEDISKSNIGIVEIDGKLRQKGLSIFKKQTSKNARFTDCLNMAILKKENLAIIFSFDEHYKKNGFFRLGVDKPIDSIT